MEFLENVALAPYTTFRIGGPARWFAEAATDDDLAAGLAFVRDRRLPLFVLGGGSNLLVSDRGFAGLVLRVVSRGITRRQEGGYACFSVAAGEEWDAFVARAVEEDCAGVECLSGIPGSVGGTPVQNVGAYGQEVSETITRVHVLDRQTLQFRSFTNAECRFAYRQSVFNSTARDRYIVCRVDFALRQHGQPAIVYEDLKRAMEGRSPSLAETRSAVRSIRARKGMLIVPNGPDSLSAGSFFRNPIVPATVIEHLARVLAIERDRIPRYAAADGEVKLPAAWLLEQAGFHKGYALGRAGISSRHTLALVNRGGATAADVIALREKIVERVEARFSIHLEPEPVFVA